MKKMIAEPKRSDGAHLAWLLGLLLAGALIVAPLVWLLVPSPANAVVTSGYYVLSTISRGYDTWTVSSCSLYVVGGWNGSTLQTLDSARKYTTFMVDPPNLTDENERDTLARWAIVTPGDLDQDYNPVFYFVWHLSDGRTIRDDKPIVHMISYADYLRTAVAAVATVDYDAMDSVLSGSHGPGLWGSSGGTGVNVVRIYVRDTVGGVNVSNMPMLVYNSDAVTIEGWGITNVTGYFDFSLNDGTYLARVSTPPFYLMATANDTIVVSGATQDTAEVYSFSPTMPGGADTCVIVIYTNVPYCEGFFKIDQPQKGPLLSSSGVYLDKNEFNRTADANGIIQAALVVGSSTTPECTYHILVKNTKGKELAEWNQYEVPDSTTATLQAIE